MQANTRTSVGETVNARFTIVTPMFLGGADGQADDIRPPSVKGALRFWWRAVNWGRICNDNAFPSDIAALQELHRQESRLFGSSANETDGRRTGGQGGCFCWRSKHRDKPNGVLGAWSKATIRDGFTLSAKACANMKEQERKFFLTREALTGGTFELDLRFRPSKTNGWNRKLTHKLPNGDRIAKVGLTHPTSNVRFKPK